VASPRAESASGHRNPRAPHRWKLNKTPHRRGVPVAWASPCRCSWCAPAAAIVEDVDGKPPHRPGFGYRGHHNRQLGAPGRGRGPRAGGRVHPQLLHGDAVRAVRRRRGRAQPDHPPASGEKRSVLFNSGAEAVENAIKVARSYTRKPAVVAFDHAYHGRTNLAMALTAKSMPYKSGFGPFAPEIYRAPLSYPYRDGLLDKELAHRRRAGRGRATINVIDTQVGAKKTSPPSIIEPIQGEGGFIVPGRGLLAPHCWTGATRTTWCSSPTRCRPGFAPHRSDVSPAEHEGIEPDLICTAKGIAGGFPLSAVTGRAEIMDAPHVSGLGGTFGGKPRSFAAAARWAAIETIEQDGLIERAQQIERLMTEPLLRLQTADDRIGDVRGRGAMIAIELVKSGTADPRRPR